MSREWAVRAWQFCRQFAPPRSGIVLALGVCAGFIWLSVGGFPVNQSYEIVSINGQPLPQFITPNETLNGRLIIKSPPTLSRPTFSVIWPVIGHPEAVGWDGCNYWSMSIKTLRSHRFVLGSGYQTAMYCSEVVEAKKRIDLALSLVTRWRRGRAELVLAGAGVVIRLRPPIVAPFSQFHAP
jgi:hypothetical protein